MNLVAAEVDGHVAHVAGHDDRAGGALSEAGRRLGGSRLSSRLCLAGPRAAAFRCRIRRLEDLGRRRLARVALGPHEIFATVPHGVSIDGEQAGLAIRQDRLFVYVNDELVHGRSSIMEKPLNNRAWLMVAPVFALVLFSALLPMMTVVNYSVQDSLGRTSSSGTATLGFAICSTRPRRSAPAFRRLVEESRAFRWSRC